VRWLLFIILVVRAGVVRGEVAAEFPFEYREGLLWVQIRVAGSPEPLRFLLDSGASVSVVSLNTARRLGLSLGQPVNVSGVRTTTTGYWPQKLSATASGVTLPSDYLALDLSKLSGACEEPVDGLIGADFFKGKIVQIDFAAQKIRLLNASYNASKAQTTRLEIRRSGLCVKASVNGGKPQRLRVDTGCATALQWVTGRMQPGHRTGKVTIGLAELNIPQTQTTVSLAGRTFRDVQTGLHRDALFEGERGLLGNGLLSRFDTVTMDLRAGRLSFGRLRESQ
jgi:hypothetical protein